MLPWVKSGEQPSRPEMLGCGTEYVTSCHQHSQFSLEEEATAPWGSFHWLHPCHVVVLFRVSFCFLCVHWHTHENRERQKALLFKPDPQSSRTQRARGEVMPKGAAEAREGMSHASQLLSERLLHEWVQLFRCGEKWESYNTSFTDFTAQQWGSEKITHRSLTKVSFRLVVFQECI